MFGGLGFMLNGYFVVSVSPRGLLARVDKEEEAEALTRPGASPMVMRGRTMKGYVRVDPSVLDGRALKPWVQLAMKSLDTLPERKPKTPAVKPKVRKKAS
jgi:TfoX/Sxy family transcriptional regulator of competence genes